MSVSADFERQLWENLGWTAANGKTHNWKAVLIGSFRWYICDRCGQRSQDELCNKTCNESMMRKALK